MLLKHFTGREAMTLLCQGKVAMNSILTYMPGLINLSLKNYFVIFYSILFSSNRNPVEMVGCFCRILTENENADL